jgi:hypothetical protein
MKASSIIIPIVLIIVMVVVVPCIMKLLGRW